MNTNKKTYKPIQPIELPGLENKLFANEVGDHIDFQDYEANDAGQIYNVILRLQAYGEQHGLEYIVFHPSTCADYYPTLMEMLYSTFRVEHFYTVGVHEFYKLYW
ncbi:MAG: hypothetical protein LUC89_09415 [Oscillospiraceae bacterium]|nr:hypothetical protein [Oscillospiraceae bacterium]